jgi:hypothetical protein
MTESLIVAGVVRREEREFHCCWATLSGVAGVATGVVTAVDVTGALNPAARGWPGGTHPPLPM